MFNTTTRRPCWPSTRSSCCRVVLLRVAHITCAFFLNAVWASERAALDRKPTLRCHSVCLLVLPKQLIVLASYRTFWRLLNIFSGMIDGASRRRTVLVLSGSTQVLSVYTSPIRRRKRRPWNLVPLLVGNLETTSNIKNERIKTPEHPQRNKTQRYKDTKILRYKHTKH